MKEKNDLDGSPDVLIQRESGGQSYSFADLTALYFETSMYDETRCDCACIRRGR